MKFTIADKIFYRVPQFPLNASLEQCWPELKQSIALASPDFYTEIADVEFENLSLLPFKLKQTIRKYFNRSQYRPVPFGTFAAIGLIDPQKDDHTTTILIDDAQKANHFIDWPDKEQLAYTFSDVQAEDCFLFSNSTFYLLQNEIRYIYKSDEGYELAEISSSPLIHQLLNACLKPKRLSALLKEHLNESTSKNDLLEMIENLIIEQLLLTSKDPNIIGQDYFRRIGISNLHHDKSYVIAERKYFSGNVDKKLLRHFPALVNLLLSLNKAPLITPHLKSFKEKFLQRFDRMEMPLMRVLDPELGLGYGQLESAGKDNGITELLPLSAKNEQDNNSIKSKLANQFIGQSPVGCLYLEQLIENNDYLMADYPIANTFSALVQIVDEQIVLSSIGGYSTNQYTSRFSVGCEDIFGFCKETASFEQHANPEVLFFDVGYTAELKVDNVNRRRQIYDYQLSLLNYDTSDDPLTLNDIMVSIRNNEVILRSKKLNKRLVPRMATAYNHLRSDLSVYRFLSDLTTQGLISTPALNLPDLNPSQNYYPRVQFHNIIMSPAMWKLSGKDYSHHKSVDVPKLTSFLSSKAVPRYIKIGTSDQTLLLDIEKTDDRNYLEAQLEPNKHLHIEEAFLPVNSVIKDRQGNPYLGQLVLSMRHDHQIYNSLSLKENPSGTINRSFPPGSEWLYVEIYCHPLRADQILQKLHREIVLEHTLQIRKWFFIRYNEGGEHLRFRMHLREAAYAGYLMKAINESLQKEIETGLIIDVQLKTYVREIERYSETLIEEIEDHFFIDSNAIIQFLELHPDDRLKYQACLTLFESIVNSALFDQRELFIWINKVHHSFTNEHGFTTDSFKKLNSLIRQLEISSVDVLAPEIVLQQMALSHSLMQVLNSCAPQHRLELFTDLMHMHINRLFCQHQRTHEMLIYDLLLSKIKKERAINKAK